MGFNGSVVACYNSVSGTNYDSGGGGSGECCECCDTCSEGTKGASPPNEDCSPEIILKASGNTEAEVRTAIARSAADYGNVSYDASKIVITRADQSSTSSAAAHSTRVSASLNQAANNVYGVNTVGGRQSLRLKNGSLDLRWYLPQGYNSDRFSRVVESAVTKFDPAGKGAVFGFLRWVVRWNDAGVTEWYTGNGGAVRDMSLKDTDVAFDPRDPNQYSSLTGTYFRFDAQDQSYFWYRSDNLRPEIPQYVTATLDRLGYSLYYQYDANKRLLNIYGDTGALTPYFGYDAGQRINRVYLQDVAGIDHRATYYFYNATSGVLEQIVEPENTVTQFEMYSLGGTLGYQVSKETDPAGVVTDFSYDNTGTIRLLYISTAGRTTHFDDNEVTFSGSRVNGGTPTQFGRFFQLAYHGVAVYEKYIGGSRTYYEYLAPNTQISKEIDPRDFATTYQVNSKHFRSVIASPDGATTYYQFGSSGVDVTVKAGPRHTGSRSQATYYGYAANGLGLRTKILDPLNTAVYFGYDQRNRLAQTLDGRQNAMYFYYDAYNRNDVTLDASNQPAYFAFNANAKITKLHDALGFTTYYGYNKLDQLMKELSPTLEATYYAYDKRGLKTAQGRPGGRAAYFAYDAFHNVTVSAQVDAGGMIASYYTYDDQNNVTAEQDPNGNPTLHAYDLRRKHVRTEDALGDGSYFVYDPSGNLTEQKSGSTAWIKTDYDSMNRNVRVVRGTAGARPPAQASCLVHFNLNEESGNRYDDAGSSLVLTEGLYPVGSEAGLISRAASFTGSVVDYEYLVSSGSSAFAPSSAFTLCAWVKLSSLPTMPSPGNYTIRPVAATWGTGDSFERSYSFGFIRMDDGTVRPYVLVSSDGQNFIGTTYPEVPFPFYWQPVPEIVTDQWYHLAATFDASTGRFQLYVNGQNIWDQPSSITGISYNWANFTVGSHASMDELTLYWSAVASLEFWDGAIDELYLYNTVLQQTEISRLVQQRVDITFEPDPDPADTLITSSAYDLDGNRTISADERNFATYYEYDMINRLAKTLDPLLGSTYFGYDQNNNQIKTRNPRGFAAYFGYDAINHQTKMLDSLDRATYYGYDAVGNRTALLYPNLTASYFRYDGSKRLTTGVDQAGYATYFGFDAAGNQDRVLDPRGNATYFRFDLLDRNSAMLNAINEAVYFGYDANGNRLRVMDHIAGTSNATTYFVYDALNRVTRQVDALLRTTYFGYDSDGSQTAVSRPGTPLRTTEFGYDQFDRMAAVLAPTDDASYFGYDAASNRTKTLNPRGFAAYFGFDGLNRQSQTLNALNGSTYFGFDANGNVTRQRDVRSFTTYFQYDALDRLSQTLDARLGATQRGYDTAGNVARILPPVGNATYFTYDSRNLLTQVVDGGGGMQSFGYDANGNRVSVASGVYGSEPYGTSPYGGEAALFAYDALNRLRAAQDGMGGNTYFGYDVGGNTDRVLDPLIRMTYFGYDKIDRIVKVRDALNNSVYFGYDLAGNRDREQDARLNTTYYFYDVGDRLSAVLDPLKVAAYYGYDANSNLIKTLDNKRTAVYFGYDALDRRVAIKYPSENQYFGYDAGGNLIKSRDDWGAAYFGYDELSRLFKRNTPRGDSVYYAYDAASNLLRLQYPQDGKACYYGYDGGQKMEKLRSPNLNSVYFGYDSRNLITARHFGNGLACYYTYDLAQRVSTMRYVDSTGGAVAYFDYGREAGGRIAQLAREGDLAIYYSYDLVDRLLQETWRRKSDNAQIYAFTYEYDATGNRLKLRKETSTGTEWESAYFSYAADNSLAKRRVQSSNTDTYFYYDANGALTTQHEGANSTYFEYGANQLVTKVTPPVADGSPWQFYYDARLNRYKIDRGGTVRFLLWDGLNVIEERDNGGALVVRYTYGYSPIYGIGSCVEIFVPGAPDKTYTLVMDHRGTGHMLLDESGAEVGRRYYDAFGVILGSTGSWPTDLAYQTNWQTIQIGTKWWGLSAARLYDFTTGRFAQRDPLPTVSIIRSHSPGRSLGIYGRTKFSLHMNRDTSPFTAYLYAFSDLTSNVDPIGLFCCCESITITSTGFSYNKNKELGFVIDNERNRVYFGFQVRIDTKCGGGDKIDKCDIKQYVFKAVRYKLRTKESGWGLSDATHKEGLQEITEGEYDAANQGWAQNKETFDTDFDYSHMFAGQGQSWAHKGDNWIEYYDAPGFSEPGDMVKANLAEYQQTGTFKVVCIGTDTKKLEAKIFYQQSVETKGGKYVESLKPVVQPALPKTWKMPP